VARAKLILGTAGAVALASASLAVANSGGTSDPKGDVKHNPPGKDARYDIVSIAYGHGAGGQLVQRVRVKGKVFGFKGTGPPPLLWIDVPGKVATRPGCNYSDYFVIDGEVDQCGDGPKTGDATVKKLNKHTLQFSFSPQAIGSPSQYGIAFVEEGSNGNGLIFYDRAPNKGFFKHKLK
jgi:hypothetical protein